MTIKVKIKKKKSLPEASYPRLGVGVNSNDIYVQKERSGVWLRVTSSRVGGFIGSESDAEGANISPLERGQSITLTQE